MSILDEINAGDELVIKADSCLGYTFRLRQVFTGTDGRIYSFDATDKSGRQAAPVIWGFPEAAMAGFAAKGLLKRYVDTNAKA